MFKIQLENSEFYKSKSGRVQHYRSTEKAEAKLKKLGEIALNAIVVESKAKTAAAKAENPEEIVTDHGEFVTDAEAAKGTIGKTKKTKKNEKT